MDCENCKESLANKRYANVEAKPYCEDCFNKLFMNKTCGRCEKNVDDRRVEFDELTYHPECFTCGKCSKPLHVRKKSGMMSRFNQHFDTGNEVFIHGSTPYCQKCYQEDLSHMCKGCRTHIKGKFAEFEGKFYHDECFTCRKCNTSVAGCTVYLIRGLIHCEKCSEDQI